MLSSSTLKFGITDNVATQRWAFSAPGSLSSVCAQPPKLRVYEIETSTGFRHSSSGDLHKAIELNHAAVIIETPK